MKNIFVGNLSFAATSQDVQKLFEQFGNVTGVMIMERKKGKSRGYGFVDMPDQTQANAAIAGLEGKEFMGRILSVSAVRPKDPSAPKKKYRREGSQEERKPYQRDDRESKPWVKKEGYSKPYQKDDTESKPWVIKKEGYSKPYRKDDRETKRPYSKDDRSPKSHTKYNGPSWNNSEGGSKPYTKYNGQSKSRTAKPYVKTNAPKKEWDKSKGYNPFRKSDRGPGSSGPKSFHEGTSKPPYKKFASQSPSRPVKKGYPKPKPGGAFKMFYKGPKGQGSKPRGSQLESD